MSLETTPMAQVQKKEQVLPLNTAIQIIDNKYINTEPKSIEITSFQPNLKEEPESKIDKNGKSRRKPSKWSIEEQEFLLNGCRKFSNCWTQILKEYPMIPTRNRFDLKDKWKNLTKKGKEPEFQVIFQEISDCNAKRKADLSLGAHLFMQTNENDQKKHDKDEYTETIKTIKNRMEEIIPRRHQAAIFASLENNNIQAEVIRDWRIVESNQDKVFEFIEKYRNI